jgi:hypothetical protein
VHVYYVNPFQQPAVDFRQEVAGTAPASIAVPGATSPTRYSFAFFEHFVYIAHVMDECGGEGIELR